MFCSDILRCFFGDYIWRCRSFFCNFSSFSSRLGVRILLKFLGFSSRELYW